MGLGHLAQIDPSAFAHPQDLQTTRALKRVPFLDTLLKQVSRFETEEFYRAHYMHSGILLGPRQLPSLWRMVQEVAERFEMTEPVTAYVVRGSGPNAFAFGLHRHSIALTSSLVDLMSDRELEAIIAHEISHVLCRHMLFRRVGLTLANGTTRFLKALPSIPSSVVRMSLHGAYLAWCRAAEYSADRAAALVLRDPEVMASCLTRLAGVPRRFEDEFDPHQFAEQAEEFDRSGSVISPLVRITLELLSTHPEPTRRSVAVLQWAESEAYERILSGDFETILGSEERIHIAGVADCPACGRPVGDNPTCPHCDLEQRADRQSVCVRGHVAGIDWEHCLRCGQPVLTAAEADAAE